jgi:hypothetical protein
MLLMTLLWFHSYYMEEVLSSASFCRPFGLSSLFCPMLFCTWPNPKALRLPGTATNFFDRVSYANYSFLLAFNPRLAFG